MTEAKQQALIVGAKEALENARRLAERYPEKEALKLSVQSHEQHLARLEKGESK